MAKPPRFECEWFEADLLELTDRSTGTWLGDLDRQDRAELVVMLVAHDAGPVYAEQVRRRLSIVSARQAAREKRA